MTTVRENYGGAGWHRYWGEYLHRFGGSVGAYESELEPVAVSSDVTDPADRLAEIKGRHKWGYLDTLTERHLRSDDRAWLIGEVERLRAENGRLRYDDSPGTLLARFRAIADYVTANIDGHVSYAAKPIELRLIEDHARLRVAAGILQKLCDNYDIDTRGPHCFIGIDGDGIFITLDANEVAYLAALTDGTEAPK